MNIKKWILAFFVTLGCSISCAAQNNDYVLSQEEFTEFINSDSNIQLIDVRTPEEFSEGHIEDAVNINYNSPNFSDLVVNEYDTSRPLAIYCRSGVRSNNAAKILTKKGFKVYQLKDGIAKWKGELK